MSHWNSNAYGLILVSIGNRRLNQLYEDEFYNDDGYVPNDVLDDDDDDEDEEGPEMNALKAWRNDIADAMWAHYQLQLANL